MIAQIELLVADPGWHVPHEAHIDPRLLLENRKRLQELDMLGWGLPLLEVKGTRVVQFKRGLLLKWLVCVHEIVDR